MGETLYRVVYEGHVLYEGYSRSVFDALKVVMSDRNDIYFWSCVPDWIEA